MRGVCAVLACAAAAAGAQETRVGIVGLDTSHAVAFTKLMNDPKATGVLRNVRVVAAFPGGTDVAASWNRRDGFTAQVKEFGVEIVRSIPDLLAKVDAVMLESVDGRCHLSQFRQLLGAKKPVYIDKPLAASLADALEIARLAEQHGVPWFSSSALRFDRKVPAVGEVTGCEAWSPCSYEATHPDLFWYGVHGVEILFSILGPGCTEVARMQTPTADVVTGTWRDGRVGSFRGIRHGRRGYGATVYGTKGIAQRGGFAGYRPLLEAIARFFRTRQPPVTAAETLEMFAFMAAAEESKRGGGRPVTLASARERARRVPSRRPNILLCIADDWSWPHAGAYGDPVVRTPSFDRVAREGVLFQHAFCAAPSCTPSRGGILTGQPIHRLREGGNLHGFLPRGFPVYPDLLEAAGYAVGHSGKAWGPGRFRAGGRARNPAGPRAKSFAAFLAAVPEEQPFCFWLGSSDPHRPYKKGSGVAAGMRLEDVRVPPFLPDTEEVRADILDYYVEVQRFDTLVGDALAKLEAGGRLENTIVVVTSDNGMPFPRAKANLYDGGTRMPLAILWRAKLRGGHVSPALVSHTELAPFFLEAAGVAVPEAMTKRDLHGLLFTGALGRHERVFVERERHAHVRAGNLSYPVRGIRTRRFLYLRNLRPDRWPAGDPEHVFSVGPFGDVDDSPSKRAILGERGSEFFRLAFGKRPAVEMYALEADPWQVVNVAGDARYAEDEARLSRELERWMVETGDPRSVETDDRWDAYPYFGRPARQRR